MALRWQTGLANATRGAVVQVTDVGSTRFAALEDPDIPDHVITRDYADQDSSEARRAVQFQRYVEGGPHGESWASTMGGKPSVPPAPAPEPEPDAPEHE